MSSSMATGDQISVAARWQFFVFCSQRKQDHPTPPLLIGFLCAMESSPLTLHWKMALIFTKEGTSWRCQTTGASYQWAENGMAEQQFQWTIKQQRFLKRQASDLHIRSSVDPRTLMVRYMWPASDRTQPETFVIKVWKHFSRGMTNVSLSQRKFLAADHWRRILSSVWMNEWKKERRFILLLNLSWSSCSCSCSALEGCSKWIRWILREVQDDWLTDLQPSVKKKRKELSNEGKWKTTTWWWRREEKEALTWESVVAMKSEEVQSILLTKCTILCPVTDCQWEQQICYQMRWRSLLSLSVDLGQLNCASILPIPFHSIPSTNPCCRQHLDHKSQQMIRLCQPQMSWR
jgi:hypothetical protein